MPTVSRYSRNQLIALATMVALVTIGAIAGDGALGNIAMSAALVAIFLLVASMDRHTISGDDADERQRTVVMRSHALSFRIMQGLAVIVAIIAGVTDAPRGTGMGVLAVAFGLPLLTTAWVERNV